MRLPDVGEDGAVLRLGQPGLGLDDVLRPDPGEGQRRQQPLGYDELRLAAERLPAPLQPVFDQRGLGDAAAARLRALGHRRAAGQEDEIAGGERRRVARARPRPQRRVVEMADLRPPVGERDHLPVELGARQQESLLDDRGAGRDRPPQPPSALGLERRHHRDAGVELVGPDDAAEPRLGFVEHRLDVVERAGGLARALRPAGVRCQRPQHVGGDAGAVVLGHVAGREHPRTGPHCGRVEHPPASQRDGADRRGRGRVVHGPSLKTRSRRRCRAGRPRLRAGRRRGGPRRPHGPSRR